MGDGKRSGVVLALAAGLLVTGCPKPSTNGAPAGEAPTTAPSASASSTTKSAASTVVVDAGPKGPVLNMEGAVTSSDGTKIASNVLVPDAQGIERNEVHIWDGKTKAHLRAIVFGVTPSSMVFSADGKVLFVGFENSPPASYDAALETPPAGQSDPFFVKTHPLPKQISPNADYGVGSLAVSDDGAWLAARCATVNVCVWSLKSNAVRMWMLPPLPEAAEAHSGLNSLRFQKGTARLDVETDLGRKVVLDVVTLKPAK